jgi:hypothetical protein
VRPVVRTSRVALAIALAGIVAVGGAPLVGARSDQGPDIKVALISDGRCGKQADALPVLVAATGTKPGDLVGDITVCIWSRGGQTLTLISLTAVELLDVEGACTGDEAAVDTTCGAGQQGELSASLVHQIGTGICPSVSDARLLVQRRLSDLAASPVALGLMGRNDLVCVRMRVRLQTADPSVAARSQTDRSSWRYAFSLTSLED